MHIGILQTDKVLPNFQAEHGDLPDMFQALFGQLEAHHSYTVYDAQSSLPNDIDCAAYIITGSKCSVYDDSAWIRELAEFVAKILAAGRKIIGVCFGHQLMAHFFGGKVVPAAAGWAVGVHTSFVVEHNAWMNNAETQVALLSSHKDQVESLPEGATTYLSNDFCPIGGFTVGSQIITVQGHPEFSKGYAHELMTMRQSILGEKVFQAGVASLSQPTDELLVAQWLLAFCQPESVQS